MSDPSHRFKLGATAAYTYGYRGTGMTLEDYLVSIRTLPTLGLHRFDLEILQAQHVPIFADDKNIDLLKAALEKNGVRAVGFTAWVCLELIHSSDPADHARGFELFARIAAIAQKLDANYIHLGSDMIKQYITTRDPSYVQAPATGFALPADVRLSDVLDSYARRLARLARIAADHNLRFTLEPRANSLVNGPDGFLDIAHRAGHPNLFACLDLVHLAYHRFDPCLAIEKLGDYLAVLQLCNSSRGEMIHLPLGEGELDIAKVLATVKKVAFPGYLMLEIYRGGNDAKEEVDKWYRGGAEQVAKALPLDQGAD